MTGRRSPGVSPTLPHAFSVFGVCSGDTIPFVYKRRFRGFPNLPLAPSIHLRMKRVHRAKTTLLAVVSVDIHYDARQTSHRAILLMESRSHVTNKTVLCPGNYAEITSDHPRPMETQELDSGFVFAVPSSSPKQILYIHLDIFGNLAQEQR